MNHCAGILAGSSAYCKSSASLSDLRKAYAKTVAPRAVRAGFYADLGKFRLGVTGKKQLTRITRSNAHGGSIQSAGPAYVPSAKIIGSALSSIPGGEHLADKITMGHNAYNLFSSRFPGAAAGYTPGNKEVINRMVGLHEAAERQASGWLAGKNPSSPYVKFFGHMDPSVLLKEHNILASLPAEHSRVAETMRNLRLTEGEAQILDDIIPGFRFGTGKRVSRGMVKKLTPIARNKYIDKHVVPQLDTMISHLSPDDVKNMVTELESVGRPVPQNWRQLAAGQSNKTASVNIGVGMREVASGIYVSELAFGNLFDKPV